MRARQRLESPPLATPVNPKKTLYSLAQNKRAERQARAVRGGFEAALSAAPPEPEHAPSGNAGLDTEDVLVFLVEGREEALAAAKVVKAEAEGLR